MSDNLYELLVSGFAGAKDRLCLSLADGRQLSFGDVEALAGKMANGLRSLGVEPGDRVAVQVDKTPEALCLYLATLKVGAIFLPLNTAYQKGELAHFIGDAEPRLFVCRPESQAALRALPEAAMLPHLLTLGSQGEGSFADLAAAQPSHGACHPAQADDIAALLYTSGTTGRSKGAMLTHCNLGSNIVTLRREWGFRPDDVLLHTLPIFHTHGLFVAAGVSLLNGSPMIFLPSFDADQVVGFLPRASVFMGVPTFYTRLLAHRGLTRDLVAHMRLFVSGSAPLLAETHREFEARTGLRILERYGMTETSMNTSNPYAGERRAGTVGLPLPGIEVRVADDSGKPLAPGEIGMIEVRGPNVFKGYWRQPEKTREEFRPDGFFITGDVGRIDRDGYVHIVGRAKDLIISGGFNIYPREVEDVIDRLDGVLESAVIGVPHPDFGEAVVALVRFRNENVALSQDDIIAAVKSDLASFKAPKAVFFIEDFPRNAMGKIQKNLLRQQYGTLFTCAA